MTNRCRYHLGAYLFVPSPAESSISTGLELERCCTTDMAAYWTFLSFSVLFWSKINNCNVATSAEKHRTGKPARHPNRRGLGKTLGFALTHCLGLTVPFQERIYTTTQVLGPQTGATAEMGILSSSEMQYWQLKTSVNIVFYWQDTSNFETGTAIRLLV